VPTAMTPALPATTVALHLENVTKRFGGVTALQDVTLTVARGEIHGLVGENGSGKSTLVKIIGGYLEPDDGSARGWVWGRPLSFPVDVRHQPIAVIHQDLALVDNLSAVENIGFPLNFEQRAWTPVHWGHERRAAEALLDRIGVQIDVLAPVGWLSPAERAAVAVARSMRTLDKLAGASEERLFVLDEPTSYLSGAEAARVGSIIREVAARGASVVIVSHHLAEINEWCDSVTVLRSGKLVCRRQTEGLTERDLVRLMLGRNLAEFYPPKPKRDPGVVALETQGLSGRVAEGVDLVLREGEVVGVSGLIGMGQNELPYLIVGAQRRRAGKITGPGGRNIRHIRDARRQGVVLVPGDRQQLAFDRTASATENVTLPILRRFVRRGIVRRRRERTHMLKLMETFTVHPPLPDQPVTAFSGGNQQKLLLARWLQTEPKVLLLDEPTNGVDARARADILQFILERAATGAAVAIFSTDLEQLAAVCHRVVVLRRGVVTAEIAGELVTEEALYRAVQGAAI